MQHLPWPRIDGVAAREYIHNASFRSLSSDALPKLVVPDLFAYGPNLQAYGP